MLWSAKLLLIILLTNPTAPLGRGLSTELVVLLMEPTLPCGGGNSTTLLAGNCVALAVLDPETSWGSGPAAAACDVTLRGKAYTELDGIELINKPCELVPLSCIPLELWFRIRPGWPNAVRMAMVASMCVGQRGAMALGQW